MKGLQANRAWGTQLLLAIAQYAPNRWSKCRWRHLEQHSRSLGSRPIRVLSTGKHGVHSLDPSRPPDPEQQKYEAEVARQQAKWLEFSLNARQLFTDKSSEYIRFDQPAFVVDAIREVYTQSKRRQD